MMPIDYLNKITSPFLNRLLKQISVISPILYRKRIAWRQPNYRLKPLHRATRGHDPRPCVLLLQSFKLGKQLTRSTGKLLDVNRMTLHCPVCDQRTQAMNESRALQIEHSHDKWTASQKTQKVFVKLCFSRIS